MKFIIGGICVLIILLFSIFEISGRQSDNEDKYD